MDAAARRTVGRYCLYHPLASGGAATVYLGALRGEGGFTRTVAIKKLHEHRAKERRFVEALQVEARIASRIRHPNVAAVLDVVSDGEDQLVILEYVHGAALSQLVTPDPSTDASEFPPVEIALRIVVDALEGLHAAHEVANERGVPLLVVHRDVSPQNIMVDVDGRARVVDFGIAKALERPFATTAAGEFRGKLAYASPEQLDAAAVDRRTDIWAIGVVLWELLAGQRFCPPSDPAQIVRRITTDPIAPPSSLNPACPAELDAIVARALARPPDDRYSSAREMALAIEKTGRAGTHRETARWVKRVARERLDERSLLISEMETELRDDAAAEPAEPAALAASSTVATSAPSAALLRRRRGWLMSVFVSLAVLAALVVAAVTRQPSAAAPSAPSAVQASIPEPSSSTVAPPSVASATTAPGPSAAARAPSRPAAPRRPTPTPATPAHAPTGAAAPSTQGTDPLGMERRN